MPKVRWALFMASLSQYLRLAASLATIALVSRMLTPAEIGVAVIGGGVVTIVFAMRDFLTPEFLVPLPAVQQHDVRTSATVTLCITVALGLVLMSASPWVVDFYGQSGLRPYIFILVLAAVGDFVSLPRIALLRRDLRFGAIAAVDAVTVSVTSATTIAFAMNDWSFMSFAFGTAFGNLASAALLLYFEPCWWSFRPSMRSLPAIVEFGRYRGATLMADRAYDALPLMILGRTMSAAAVGTYNRAVTLSGLPDKLVLSSIFSVAFPALSAAIRSGADIKSFYLRALTFITVFYWPALLLTAILVQPLVHFILGDAWDEVIPITRLLSIAAVFWFPVILTFPLLMALAANKEAFVFNVFTRSTAAVILAISSLFGLKAIALGQFVSLPFQMVASFLFIRKHVAMSWRDIFQAIAPSAAVTATTIVGPLMFAMMKAVHFEYSIPETLLSASLAAIGWVLGLKLVSHPLLDEIDDMLGGRVRGFRRWVGAK